MRWIFFLLLAVNAVVPLVHYLGYWPEAEGVKNADVASWQLPEGVSRLQLASESAQVAQKPTEPRLSNPSEPGARKLCTMVGEFASEQRAEAFVERLRALDLRSEVQEIQLSTSDSYWVYLPAEATREAAQRKLSELQSLDIDSYIIPRGELANSISLGVFSRESLARARLQALRERGLAVELHKVKRNFAETWVYLAHGEREKIADTLWQELINDEFELEERQNFCLDVASEGNFH